ncbi:acyl-CoA carboxylase subunit epsilon [Nocardioides guangzhouensis]|uniref:Acyl-CoA carboxylase subunit epsilon n=1 Tax=Nocardioides guangzhouensis TaxID=2497878 RepID=A0A4Q4Z7L6_9ACTN|nr:acyl-CoA carboxylase subunit epsilon [Nocardioides guangzhouensis]RYP83395.1 acyl-CoA carboxylase subunit epsilon [Nocardioides guangzhouensis]
MVEERAPASVSKPLLTVVNPDATPEEVAALVAVLASLGAPATPAPRRTPGWQARHRLLRATHPHGPGGWRSSGLPR